MGKILIIYDTDSDRRFTETMVPLVKEGAESVDGMEVRVRHVDDAKTEDVFWADGIAIGCPTHLGNISWRMKKWWDDRTPEIWFKTDGKFAVPFTSAGSLGGGGELACNALSIMMMNMGYFVFGITDYVAKKESLHYGAVVAGEPRSDHAKESCRRAGRRLAEWVGFYMEGRKDLHPLDATYNRFWELAD
jgi:NAD(P)H dehydrogenase (quinone)